MVIANRVQNALSCPAPSPSSTALAGRGRIRHLRDHRRLHRSPPLKKDCSREVTYRVSCSIGGSFSSTSSTSNLLLIVMIVMLPLFLRAASDFVSRASTISCVCVFINKLRTARDARTRDGAGCFTSRKISPRVLLASNARPRTSLHASKSSSYCRIEQRGRKCRVRLSTVAAFVLIPITCAASATEWDWSSAATARSFPTDPASFESGCHFVSVSDFVLMNSVMAARALSC